MGTRFASQVDEIPCKRYLTTNGTHKWWTPKAPDLYWAREKKEKCSFIKHVGLYECIGTEATPFLDIPQISKFWEGIGRKNPNFWEAPEGLFWVCGETAYVELPENCLGSCTTGVIRPSCFLLPQDVGQELGIPLYDELGRMKRDLVGGSQKRGDDEWPQNE